MTARSAAGWLAGGARSVPSGCAVQATLLFGSLLALFLNALFLGHRADDAGSPAPVPVNVEREAPTAEPRNDGPDGWPLPQPLDERAPRIARVATGNATAYG